MSTNTPDTTHKAHRSSASSNTSDNNSSTATKAPFIRSPYNYDVKAASDECAITNFGESKTLQSMAEDADINVILERMKVTGQMPEPPPALPKYGDYTDVVDYRTALERVNAAQESFMQYPAKLRAEFDNDPAKFLDFVSDPKNKPRMAELGLIRAPEPEKPLSRDTQAIIDAVKTPQGPQDKKSSGTT